MTVKKTTIKTLDKITTLKIVNELSRFYFFDNDVLNRYAQFHKMINVLTEAKEKLKPQVSAELVARGGKVESVLNLSYSVGREVKKIDYKGVIKSLRLSLKIPAATIAKAIEDNTVSMQYAASVKLTTPRSKPIEEPLE